MNHDIWTLFTQRTIGGIVSQLVLYAKGNDENEAIDNAHIPYGFHLVSIYFGRLVTPNTLE